MEFKTIIAQLESGECMISNQVSTPQVEHTTKNLVIFTVAAGLLLLTCVPQDIFDQLRTLI